MPDLALAALAALGVLAGVFYIYTVTRDLPSVEALQNYSPPVTTRVYAGNGTVLGEYARERRIFVPAAFIPKLVTKAFTSAEDRNFYSHPGIDPSRHPARRDQGCGQLVLEGTPPARRLHHHPAGGAQFPAQFRRQDSAARSAKRSWRSASTRPIPRTRSSSSISTKSIWARTPMAWPRRR